MGYHVLKHHMIELEESETAERTAAIATGSPRFNYRVLPCG
jgi:hypothetical protein